MLASHYPPPSRFRTAWFILDQQHPPLLTSFFLLVLPLSLLPPAMLYYAGTFDGDEFMAGFADRNWVVLSLIILAAELITVAVMGFVIRWIASLNGAQVSLQRAQLMAFAAPVPLWLSSLSLLYPNFYFSAAVCSVAFAVSCLAIFHGVKVLMHIDEDIAAANIAYGIMSSGAIAWALLLIMIMPLG